MSPAAQLAVLITERFVKSAPPDLLALCKELGLRVQEVPAHGFDGALVRSKTAQKGIIAIKASLREKARKRFTIALSLIISWDSTLKLYETTAPWLLLGKRVRQIWLAEAQEQPGDGQHRNWQHQRAANPLQTGKDLFHVVTRGRARWRRGPKQIAVSVRGHPPRFRYPTPDWRGPCSLRY